MADVTACRVAMLFGGWSDEREISRASATACAAALARANFSSVEMLDVAAPDFVTTLATGAYDVAFVAMHGRFGEDGCVQGLLEVLGIPYTFSGVCAQAVAMEKDLAKVVFDAAGIPTPRGVVLPAGEQVGEAQAAEIVEELGLPLFVKPAANGSSYGVSKVFAARELPGAVAAASAGGQRVLVEAAVEGTEVSVPVIGNADPQALPVVEVVSDTGFYDLATKYEPSELHHVIPARLSPDAYERVQAYAVAAHRALGCAGCSRSDLIVEADGTACLLETNTIPGMTETSLLPDSARHAGIGFEELCRRFVEMALEAHGTRAARDASGRA